MMLVIYCYMPPTSAMEEILTEDAALKTPALQRDVWTFYVADGISKIVVEPQVYERQLRQSTRHKKWTTEYFYTTSSLYRGLSLNRLKTMTGVPKAIAKHAIDALHAKIEIVPFKK